MSGGGKAADDFRDRVLIDSGWTQERGELKTGPIRDQPSESSASPQASSTTPQSSPMSCQKPRSSLSPAPVYINKENLAGAATNSQIAALGEQLNILIEENTRWQKKNIRWQKKVTKVLVEVAMKLDVPTDGLKSEDEDPADELA